MKLRIESTEPKGLLGQDEVRTTAEIEHCEDFTEALEFTLNTMALFGFHRDTIVSGVRDWLEGQVEHK